MSVLRLIRSVATHPLNRRRKARALWLLFRWQIGSRLVPGSVAFDWVGGSRFLVRTGDTSLTGNVYSGLFEFEEMAFLHHVLRPEDQFVDVGANHGAYTVLACSSVGASGVAFEPSPGSFERLSENVRFNEMESRVKCLNVGVGAERGTVTFTNGAGAMNHALAPGESRDDTVEVRIVPLDQALKGESPFLIKVDVEGYESLVIAGGGTTFAAPSLQAVIMELNDSGQRYGFSDSAIVDEMCDFGFRPYSYDPFLRDLTELSGKNQESGNTIFVRDVSVVKSRIESAPRVHVHGLEL